MEHIIKDEFVRFMVRGWKRYPDNVPTVSLYNADANGNTVENFMTIVEVQALMSLLGSGIHQAEWAEEVHIESPTEIQ